MTETARLKTPVPCDLAVAMIDKISNGFNLCHHKNFWPSTLILYSRGSQPGVHAPQGVHSLICRVHSLYICNKLNLRHENGLYLYSFKILKVLLKIQHNFSILLRLFVRGNFRGTCSSIKMLKGYVFRIRLGTSALMAM